jgi:uncharacterized membrane protein YjjP (DUF1212 family)
VETHITQPTPPSQESADRVLRTALDVGENLLKNGAAVHRAEDTIERICRALGASHVEVFCIPSLVIATMRMKSGEYASQTRRIYANANHFARIDRLNSISRSLCSGSMTIDEAQEAIRQANRLEVYPPWLQLLGSLLISSGFCVFFGGSLLDSLAAGIVAFVISILSLLLPKTVNALSYTLIASLLAGIGSILLWKVGLAQHYDKVMIGTIMLLIPGLAFGTSIRDLLCGDTLAGLLQFIQSLLKAVIIAFGYSIAIFLLRSLIG